jgi:hypothetical protein
MTWNYRVVREPIEGFLAIHECHYDGTGKPVSITTEPVIFGGDTVEDIRWALQRALDALDKPILDEVGFDG